MAEAGQGRPRGRPAAASRTDVVRAAVRRFLALERVDVQAIAAELGLARATVYRWFGSREQLMGEAVLATTVPVLQRAAAAAEGTGAEWLLDAFDRFNRGIAAAPPLLALLESERETAIRLLTSGAGVVQPGMVAEIQRLIDDRVSDGSFRPQIDTGTLAYAIVRLAEAFLYNDAMSGIRGDVERLREVEALLLGVGRRRPRA